MEEYRALKFMQPIRGAEAKSVESKSWKSVVENFYK